MWRPPALRRVLAVHRRIGLRGDRYDRRRSGGPACPLGCKMAFSARRKRTHHVASEKGLRPSQLPLERIETAISWLKANGSRKIGIAGASTTGTLALTAASMFPDITPDHCHDAQRLCGQGFMQANGTAAASGRWRANRCFPTGEAAALYAILLQAPRLLALHRRREQAHRRYGKFPPCCLTIPRRLIRLSRRSIFPLKTSGEGCC